MWKSEEGVCELGKVYCIYKWDRKGKDRSLNQMNKGGCQIHKCDSD